MRKQEKTPLHLDILTNNLGIHQVWQSADPRVIEKIDLELTGGECDVDRNILCGYIAEESVNTLFHPDIVILGTSGLSFDKQQGGFYYNGTTSQRVIKVAMLRKPTKHRIIACHHSKICQTSAFTACSAEELTVNAQRMTVITTEPPPERMEELSQQIILFNQLVNHLKKRVNHYHNDLLRLIFLDTKTGNIARSFP